MLTKRSEETSDTAAPPMFAVIIANPASGSFMPHTASQLQETIGFLQNHGWKVALRLTEAAGDGRRLAREAVIQKAEMVIAAGGDGTIHEVIQELAGTETALGVLPLGTVNVWARETGIPLDIHAACQVLVHGRIRRIDLGRVNGHYFLLMVGIGLDGEVTHKVEKHPLKRLGVIGYLLASLWYGLAYQGFLASVISGEQAEQIPALQIVIGNTQLYAGAIKFTWRAKGDDGLLDVCILKKQSILGRLIVAMEFFLRRKEQTKWISYERRETIEIQTPKPVSMQVDGDPIGYTPASIRVVPSALRVVVPHTTSEGLFLQK